MTKTLRNPKELSKTGEITEGYVLSQDKASIEYADAVDNTVIANVTGVKSTDGLELYDKNGEKLVIVYKESFNEENITLDEESEFSFELGDEMAPESGEGWQFDPQTRIAEYHDEGWMTKGYVRQNDKLIEYKPEVTGGTSAIIEGVNSKVDFKVIEDEDGDTAYDEKTVQLTAFNFQDSVRVVENTGNLKFDIAEGEYNEASFAGLSTADTVVNSGSGVHFNLGEGNDEFESSGEDVSVHGGAGKDKIFNTGKNVTIYGGADNDNISLSESSVGGGNVLFYASGDGKDKVSLFGSDDVIRIADGEIPDITANVKNKDVVFGIGKGSIKLKNGATTNSKIRILDSTGTEIESVSGNTYTEKGIIKDGIIKLATTFTGEYIATKSVNAQSGVEIEVNVVDGSQLEEGASLNAGTHGESILGGIGKDTLISGDQEFSFTGGEGNDVFFYNGGTGRITDYSMGGTNGKDKIRIADGLTFRQFDTKTNNLILTYADADNNLNYVTIDGGRGKEITFGTNKAVTNIFNDDGIFDAKGKGVSIGGNSESDKNKDTFEALRGYAKIITINASMANYEIKLTGNKKANLIIAGSEGSTINGGKGKDTLVGGDGRDIFVYEANSGNKLIKNYTYSASGGDVISLGSDAKIDAIEEKGANLVLSVGNNKITIEGGAGNPFKFDDGSEKIAQDNMFISTDGKSASLTSAYTAGNEFTLGEGNSWKNFDAGEGSSAYLITGDTEDNSLVGGKKADSISGGDGNDSIRGGKGNDTLWGGDGNDTFIFYAGDGTDRIMDFGEGDMLQILDKRGLRPAKFKGKYSDKNETLTLNITGGGKIILENISAESTFIINNAEHKISGNKLK